MTCNSGLIDWLLADIQRLLNREGHQGANRSAISLSTIHVQFSSVQFSSVQDSICAHGEAHMCSTPSFEDGEMQLNKKFSKN